MADRILAPSNAERILQETNPAGLGSAALNTVVNYVRGGSHGGVDVQKGKPDSAAVCNPEAAQCDVVDAKEYNENEWLRLVGASSLPRGRARVTLSTPVYTLQVMWDQERDGSTVNCTITNCFQMEVRLQ